MKLQTKIRTNPTVPDKNTEPDYFLYHDEDKKNMEKKQCSVLNPDPNWTKCQSKQQRDCHWPTEAY